MVDFKRREVLYLTAAGIGTAFGIQQVTDTDPGIAPPAVGGGDGDHIKSPTGTQTATGPTWGFEVAAASSIGNVPEPQKDVQIVLILGNNRVWGIHLNYTGTKPVVASNSVFELVIADDLASVPDPQIEPQFIYVDGHSRDWGAHVNYSAEKVLDGPDSEWAVDSLLGDVTSADTLPQISSIVGITTTHGVHVDNG